MTKPPSERPRLLERLLLNVFGPPSVLDPSAPPREFEPVVEHCTLCGQPRDSHPVKRHPRLGSVTRCPSR